MSINVCLIDACVTVVDYVVVVTNDISSAKVEELVTCDETVGVADEGPKFNSMILKEFCWFTAVTQH